MYLPLKSHNEYLIFMESSAVSLITVDIKSWLNHLMYFWTGAQQMLNVDESQTTINTNYDTIELKQIHNI